MNTEKDGSPELVICKFCLAYDGSTGQCRRRSPTVVVTPIKYHDRTNDQVNYETVWPVVAEDYWCREWEV